MGATSVADIAGWATEYANFPGAPSPVSIEFGTGWIATPGGKPPCRDIGGLYVFGDATGLKSPPPLDECSTAVCYVGKADKDAASRFSYGLARCTRQGVERIVHYTISVDSHDLNAFTPSFATSLEKYVFACSIRHYRLAPGGNTSIANGRPNHNFVRSMPGSYRPSAALVARWARDFSSLSGATIPVSLAFHQLRRGSLPRAQNPVYVVTEDECESEDVPIESSKERVVCICTTPRLLPTDGHLKRYIVSPTWTDSSASNVPLARALELYLKYSFVRCAGVRP